VCGYMKWKCDENLIYDEDSHSHSYLGLPSRSHTSILATSNARRFRANE
jgi:hypothetical protein